MTRKKRGIEEPARAVLSTMLFLTLFSAVAFSLHIVYSENIILEVSQGYGIYKNGIIQDTHDVLVASPFSVKVFNVSITNFENYSRNISVEMPFTGMVSGFVGDVQIGAGKISWDSEFAPFEENGFMIFGTDLELGGAVLRKDDANSNDSIKNNVSENITTGPVKSNASEANFSYTASPPQSGMFDSIFQAQRALGLTEKAIIIVLGGIVILAVVSGITLLTSRREPSGKPPTKPRIFIEDMYHNEETVSEDYKYPEEDYWKKKIYKKID